MRALTGSPEVKSRTRKRKVTPAEEATSDTVSFQATRRLNAKSRNDFTLVQDSPQSALASTPRGKRRTRQTRDSCLTSTPVHSSFTDRVPQILDPPPEANQETLDCTTVFTPLKVFGHIVQVILISQPKVLLCCSSAFNVCPFAEVRARFTALHVNISN